MSDEQKEIEVFESNRFGKQLNKFSETNQSVIEDEIDKIIDNPSIGESKKGDLTYLRVHKFILNSQQILLGYSFFEQKLTLTLLQLGSHENFYSDAKNKRKSDLKLIG